MTGTRFEFRCSDEFLKRVRRRADSLGISTAAFVKAAVHAALEPVRAGGVASMTDLPHCPHTRMGVCEECREPGDA